MDMAEVMSKEGETVLRDIVDLRNIGGTIRWVCDYGVRRGFLIPSFCIRDRSVLG